MTTSARLLIVIFLLLAGACLSWFLLLSHYGEGAAVSAICGESPESGCDVVNRSPYAEVAGIPLAALGLFFYLSLAALLVLAAIADPEVRHAAAGIAFWTVALALTLDVALFGLQAFAIRAFCKLCLATYALNVGALVALLPARGAAAGARGLAARAEGRLVAAGWAFGSLALGGTVAAASLALSAREAGRTATLLGKATPAAAAPARAPVFAATPATAPTTMAAADPGKGKADPGDVEKYRAMAREAEERARRLQETIDDPKKLEQYFTEKAAKEFDRAPSLALDLKGVPFKGPAEAPIHVTEFSDFLCPYCRSVAGAFANYLPQSANRVAVYFKNYPLDQACNVNVKQTIHAGACWVALGGLCAHEQGKFWPYHDRVFTAPPTNPVAPDVVKLATEAGLNGPALETCMNAPATKDRLTAQIAEGARSGVQGTPALYINGRRLPRVNDFIQAVDKESALLGLPPLPPPQPQPPAK